MSHIPIVLVTGAARRVGAAVARLLHQRGAALMLHFRSLRADAEALAQELNAARPDSVAVHQADLANPSACEDLLQATIARFGQLDGLVNNASSFFPTPVGQISEADCDDLFGSNLRGPIWLSQAAAPYLRARQGAIVNITDVHAERPLKGYAIYCSAKAGLLGLTRALAVDLAPEVRVNAVAPGAIIWPEDDSYSAVDRQAVIDASLLKRVGTPDDIARAVAFMLFDAPYVTGQELNVDGGRSIYLPR